MFRPRGDGAVAQLGERVVRNDEVSGSIPLSSTIPASPYAIAAFGCAAAATAGQDCETASRRGTSAAGRGGLNR
jgi:hypothetical protein